MFQSASEKIVNNRTSWEGSWIVIFRILHTFDIHVHLFSGRTGYIYFPTISMKTNSGTILRRNLESTRRVFLHTSKQNYRPLIAFQIILSLFAFQMPNLNFRLLCIAMAQQTWDMTSVSSSLHITDKFSWPCWNIRIYSGSVELFFSPAISIGEFMMSQV